MTVSSPTAAPITFASVEAARLAYHQKALKQRKIFILTSLGVLAIFAIIYLVIILLRSSANIMSYTDYAFSIMDILQVVGPLFFGLIVSFTVGALVSRLACSSVAEYQTYRHAYKAYFVTRQLAAAFTNLAYDHASGIDRATLEHTNLIRFKPDSRYRSNDLVTARYKDVAFAQADVTIEEPSEPDEDGDRTYHQVFKGRYLIFAFPKKFHSQMVVSYAGLGEGHRNPATGRPLQRIETESTTFNRHFLVYAEDGHDAFYILNPSFIENLEKLAVKYADRVVAYFTDNQMIISINDNNDAFEPPADSTVPLDEKKELSRVLEDIHCITEIVDSLRLSR